MASSSLAAPQLGRLRQAPAVRCSQMAASPPGRLHPMPLTVSFSSSVRDPAIGMTSVRNGRSPVVACGTKHLMGSVNKTDGLKFAVVVARFNEIVTNLLLEGALEAFRRYSVNDDDVTVVKVPGCFEVPVVAQRLGNSGKYDAILCIGAVIRGDTTHYDAVANSAASGVLNAGLSSGVPCVFGVLTCEDMDQALNRSGGKSGNKGAETAITAIEMASLFKHVIPK